MKKFITLGLNNLLCHVYHILAMITLLRDRLIFPQGLIISCQECPAEVVYLVSRIIYIVLSKYREAAISENSFQSAAQYSAASVANMQRTGGIYTDEFKLYFNSLPKAA